jgi:hypothetical protein
VLAGVIAFAAWLALAGAPALAAKSADKSPFPVTANDLRTPSFLPGGVEADPDKYDVEGVSAAAKSSLQPSAMLTFAGLLVVSLTPGGPSTPHAHAMPRGLRLPSKRGLVKWDLKLRPGMRTVPIPTGLAILDARGHTAATLKPEALHRASASQAVPPPPLTVEIIPGANGLPAGVEVGLDEPDDLPGGDLVGHPDLILLAESAPVSDADSTEPCADKLTGGYDCSNGPTLPIQRPTPANCGCAGDPFLSTVNNTRTVYTRACVPTADGHVLTYETPYLDWQFNSGCGANVLDQKLTGELQWRQHTGPFKIWSYHAGHQTSPITGGGDRYIHGKKKAKTGCHKYRSWGVVNYHRDEVSGKGNERRGTAPTIRGRPSTTAEDRLPVDCRAARRARGGRGVRGGGVRAG